MIEVTVQDGYYLVTLPKAILVLTRGEFIQALRRGKWFRRTHAMATRAETAPLVSTRCQDSRWDVEGG